MKHHSCAADFSRKVRNALTKKGLTVVTMHWIPGPGCDFANGYTGYMLSDGRIYSWLQVNALVA